jgi:hypothetical protein
VAVSGSTDSFVFKLRDDDPFLLRKNRTFQKNVSTLVAFGARVDATKYLSRLQMLHTSTVDSGSLGRRHKTLETLGS